MILVSAIGILYPLVQIYIFLKPRIIKRYDR